ncbi:hypothetical protein PFISCL1PPCAC_10437 [Pristionchus fissidentatus]|uniref:Uncharacterized protein n=1 Tax=Pristionchus fissidentatus TaxID=1538716 RepID=A0AAV5VMH2_9BILA|nr:hypothetical protein PFISCL1PPCAC_10437 [Pristionchus fissidentatus]
MADQRGIGWMYDGVKAEAHREDYLLGKTVDKNFEKYSDAVITQKEEVIDALAKTRVVGFSNSSSAKISSLPLNITRTEDPLVAVKVKEESKRRDVLENPLTKLRFQKMLKEMMEKKSKKPSKKEKKRKRDHSSASDDSSSDERRKKKKDKKKKHKKEKEISEDEDRHRKEKKRMRRDSSSDEHQKNSEYMQMKYQRFQSKRKDSNRSEEKKRDDRNGDRGRRNDERERRRRRDSSEEDKKRRRRDSSEDDRRKRRDSNGDRRRGRDEDDEVRRKRRDSSGDDRKEKREVERRRRDSNEERREKKEEHGRKESRDEKEKKRDYDSHIPAHLRPGSSSESEEEMKDDFDREEKAAKAKWEGFGLVGGKKKEKGDEVKAKNPYELKRLPKFTVHEKSERKKPLTEEEKAAKLREMESNAKWRDDLRTTNQRRTQLEDEKEEKDADEGRPASFVKPLLNSVAECSVEDRLKQRKKQLQRGHGYMDKL